MLRSRRSFLKLVAALGVVTIGGAFARKYGRRAADAIYRELVTFPSNETVGRLDPVVLAALLATTTALLPERIDLQRYEACFRWRAEHLAGYRAIYERFATTLDRAAQRVGHADFATADREGRRGMLEPAAAARLALRQNNSFSALRIALVHREWLVFERYIVRDLLSLFARTDAWLLAGYPSHPGMPRGLETYRQPIPTDAL